MTHALVTGHDAIAGVLGPLVVAGLEAYAKRHSLAIKATYEHDASAEQAVAADIVVLFPASQERSFDDAILAATVGFRRTVIVSDTWQKKNAVAENFRGLVSCLTVPFASEVAEAASLGYRSEHVHVVLPPHWGKMYNAIIDAPMIAAADTLQVVKGGETETRRREDVCIVYFGGAKNPPLMNKIIRAIVGDPLPPKAVLAFGPHPREWDDMPQREQTSLLREREDIMSQIPTINPGSIGSNASARVANADVSIFVGGPTDSIGGAYARRPMIYFSDSDVVAHNLAQDLPGGIWFVPNLGGALYAADDDIGGTIELLLKNPEKLRAQQEKNFPLPATWDTELTLAEAIISG